MMAVANGSPQAKKEPRTKFELASHFYRKQKDLFASKLAYADNVQLYALLRHSISGPFNHETSPLDPGMFDFEGQDRKKAWIALGELPKEEAQQQFLTMLQEKVPVFNEWLAARLREIEEKERKERERLEQIERERRARAEQEARAAAQREELRRREEALLQQQRELEAKARFLASPQAQPREGGSPAAAAAGAAGAAGSPRHPQPQQQQNQQTQQQKGAAGGAAVAAAPGIASGPQAVQEFRKAADGSLTVSRGEVMVVKVPKPPGTRMRVMWQFNTQDNDIGFGLDFEKGVAEEGKEAEVVELLPIKRCNADVEVIQGSHLTEEDGSWLLKFDNSYSWLTSKTLFYRVKCQKE